MTLVSEWREQMVAEQVDAMIIQASDLLEVAALYPRRLPGQRARIQASYLRSRAEELHRSDAP